VRLHGLHCYSCIIGAYFPSCPLVQRLSESAW
jgi:hypothetical protein